MKPSIIQHWGSDTLAQEQIELSHKQHYSNKGFSRRNFCKSVAGIGGVILGSGLWAPREAGAATGSVIKTRTISSAQENAIQMTNSRWGRNVTFPTGWSQVRIGVRLHMTDTGADLTAPNFMMGFCNGVSAIPGDTTPHHFVGYRNRTGNFGRTATYYATGVNVGLSTMSYSVCINGSYTNSSMTDGGGSQSSVIGNGAASAVADRRLILIDITKGSVISGTNYHYTFSSLIAASSTLTDISSATFLTKMVGVLPTLTGHAVYNTLQLDVDEVVNGALDSICMYWDQSGSLMEVCDVAFSRIA